MRKLIILVLASLCVVATACGSVLSEPDVADSQPSGTIAVNGSTHANLSGAANSPPESFEGIIATSYGTLYVLKSDGSLMSAMTNPQLADFSEIIPLGRDRDASGEFGLIMDNVVAVYATANADSANRNAAFLIDGNGDLWGWGSLFLEGSAIETPIEDVLPRFILPSVRQVCQNEYQYYALKEDGDLWVWGWFDGKAYFEPACVTGDVVQLLANDAVYLPDVWYEKEDGQMYQLALSNSAPYVLCEEQAYPGTTACWGSAVLTADGYVWDFTGAADTDVGQGVLIAENVIQLSGRYLSEYLAVCQDGRLIAWEDAYLGLQNDGMRSLTPRLIVEDCRYFASDAYGYYWYIDFERRLRLASADSSDRVIDLDVCYAKDSYYIKADGTLWMVAWNPSDGAPAKLSELLLSDVMMPD